MNPSDIFSRPEFPSVSIVIPVYNQRKYIEKTLNSVLGQSYERLECIVVDDGSTDGSGDVARSFGDRVTVISQKNQGQATALNKGWSAASGEILGYLSSDDLIDSNAISLLVKKMSKISGPAVVFSGYRLIDSSDQVIKEVEIPFGGYEHMLRTFICPIGPGALFDRGLFDRSGGWDITLRQLPDFEFWLRVGQYAEFAKIADSLSSFRVHAGSQTFAISDFKKAEESIAVAKYLLASNTIPSKLAAQFTASAYCFSACLHLRSGRFFWGVKRFFSGVKADVATSLSPSTMRRLVGASISRIRYRNSAN
ncbi:MAG: glycosyltransferase [Bdellovibrionales bacterium]